MTRAILSIDQGTTNSKAILVSDAGEVLARGSAPVGISHPQPGWVEQDPIRIWTSVQEAIAACLSAAPGHELAGIALSNQRESVTVWDRETGAPLGPVISWQCRRTDPDCTRLIAAGHADRVRELTGLPLDPMFPGPKLRWLVDRVPAGRRFRLGTIDAWLIHCLTGGASHGCDASNAARSQLFDLKAMAWSDELCTLFGVPKEALPQVQDSASLFGVTKSVAGVKDGTPIGSAIGDSHAALFSHRAFRPGDGKVTFGTGSSVMAALAHHNPPPAGITTTIAWALNGQPTYAFEGNILVSAASLPWMAEMLGLPDVQALTDLAATAEPGGPGFVPAFVGLGAPHWQSEARALFSAITFSTSRAQMARAVTDSLAFQVHDVFAAMAEGAATPEGALSVDGGPSGNLFLMQCVADILNRPLTQCDAPEASALGAAYLAGLSLGIWPDLAAIGALPRATRLISPTPSDAVQRLAVWRDAIFRSTVSGPTVTGE